ncbi:type III secretion system chaperone [Simkania negevensis]|uniref:Type III secretion chaperone n=1 Tax=Simkania negevensis (strain ATCC VR-1471 / DSM 27360 / Z) TaxID=331113 RepID=F8L3L0_SIMNZ|nr:type III secretion system chaperone [Simkania negevensis]CCB89869.1 type III secretion chaperone [Simkania negevensis Z]
MQAERLLEILAENLHLEAIPQKDKDGIYRLKLPPNFQVGVLELNPGVFFSSLILPIPKEGSKESLFIYLMKANLMGQGTGGGAIGIDPTEKFFTFSQSLPFEMNYQVFKESLEDFLNYITYWQEEIVRFNQTLL